MPRAIRVQTSIVGAAELARALDGMAARGENPRAAFDDVERDFREHVMPTVFSSHSAGGARWRKWATAYARRKPHGTMGRLSGGLYRSFHSRGDVYAVRKTGKDRVTVGSRHPLAHIFDKGRKPHQKPRPLVRITEPDAERWVGYVAAFVIARQGGTGGRRR